MPASGAIVVNPLGARLQAGGSDACSYRRAERGVASTITVHISSRVVECQNAGALSHDEHAWRTSQRCSGTSLCSSAERFAVLALQRCFAALQLSAATCSQVCVTRQQPADSERALIVVLACCCVALLYHQVLPPLELASTGMLRFNTSDGVSSSSSTHKSLWTYWHSATSADVARGCARMYPENRRHSLD